MVAGPSELDLYLFSVGRHERLWRMLGAHLDAGGATFAVWAPHAREVRLVSDATGWGPYEGQRMDPLGPSGVWVTTVTDVRKGTRYKFRVHGADGSWRDHADPMARATECPPRTASIVTESAYEWGDSDWCARRPDDHYQRPMSVYELHLGSWRPGLDYRALADTLPAYIAGLGFTHVELMPVMEHPFGGSWGYQVTGFYAPTARFGEPDDLRLLIDRLHQAGIGVILDWVPAHFPRDDWALARFDGTPTYEYADPRRGEHPDWGSLIFDFGRPEVRNFLISNALYWIEEFHVDGLRVDAVASMLYLDYSRESHAWEPNIFGGNEHLEAIEFLRDLNRAVYGAHPDAIMVAEESTAWPGVSRPTDKGGLGFGFKWNMGWMHDTLSYVERDPVHRQYHHDTLTLPALYAFAENYVLPISHDEVVHGKRALTAKLPGDRWRRLAGLRGLLGYMWAFPGKKLLFMGSELAAEQEWSEAHGLDWSDADNPDVAGVRRLLGQLNHTYRDTAALWSGDPVPGSVTWLVTGEASGNLIAFLRWGTDGSVLACVANFAAMPHHDYRLGLPVAGQWREVVNTDATEFGGSGVGNLGVATARPYSHGGQPASAEIQVGPLATVWFAGPQTAAGEAGTSQTAAAVDGVRRAPR